MPVLGESRQRWVGCVAWDISNSGVGIWELSGGVLVVVVVVVVATLVLGGTGILLGTVVWVGNLVRYWFDIGTGGFWGFLVEIALTRTFALLLC